MEGFEPLRRKSLLDHFSEIEDEREAWRVMYPLREVLFLVVCATIAACEDFEEIAAWGKVNLPFLRQFSEYHHGTPKARWLNILMNRMNAEVFSDCFLSWAAEFFGEEKVRQIALDGKTSRRSFDGSAHPALHMVSALATHERLVLGQEATAEKSNEITAIPALLERLAAKGALAGALVTVDAMGCNPRVTESILAHGADYLIALKGNQGTLLQDVETFFAQPPSPLEIHTEHDKGHGRIETRTAAISTDVAWLEKAKIRQIALIGRVENTTEKGGETTKETRYFVCSRAMTAADFLHGVRAHWQIENALHWVLDVTFKDDLSRVRKRSGAKNMAIVRHFALNLVRMKSDKNSLKTKRKIASWDTSYLKTILVNPDS